MSDRLVRRGNPIVLLGDHKELALPVDDEPSHLDLLSCLHCAAVLLNEKGEAVSYNSRARRLFGKGVRISGTRIVAMERASADLLAELIRTGVSGILTSNRVLLPPVVIRDSDAKPLVAQILHASGACGPDGEAATAILLLTALDAPPEIPESRLMLLFGFTPAEARLAARLAGGGALQDIADALEISLWTARNQLKSLFSKTETNRQTELVALLWRVSGMAVGASSS